MERRKLRLRPAQDLDRRAREQKFGERMAPDHLVHQVVGPVGRIGDPVGVEVEAGIVAPVVAPPFMRPIKPARADIFYLGLVHDERVAVHAVLFGPGGKMNADAALLEPVVVHLVLVRVVDKNTFGGAAENAVAPEYRVVHVVHQHAVIAVACGAVVENAQAVRVHQRVAGVVVHRAVTRDLAVVRVHVVDRETQIAEVVAPKNVALARRHENAVSP